MILQTYSYPQGSAVLYRTSDCAFASSATIQTTYFAPATNLLVNRSDNLDLLVDPVSELNHLYGQRSFHTVLVQEPSIV